MCLKKSEPEEYKEDSEKKLFVGLSLTVRRPVAKGGIAGLISGDARSIHYQQHPGFLREFLMNRPTLYSRCAL